MDRRSWRKNDSPLISGAAQRQFTAKDAEHAIQLFDRFRDDVEAFDDPHAKIAYLQGVLDWASMTEKNE
jgi:hypothetical protein